MFLYGNGLRDVDPKILLFIGVSITSYSILAKVSPEPQVSLNAMVDDISKLVQLIFLFDTYIMFQLFSTEGWLFFYVVCIDHYGISTSIGNKTMFEAIVI